MRRVAIALAIAMVPGAARAAEERACVAIDAGSIDARGRGKLVEQLGAALAVHGIATCAPGEAPLAEVTFDPDGAGEVAIRVEVKDEVTRKELVRTVRVGSIPRDGRPLALAVAGDELLRASWAEIALARAPDPPPPAPEPVRAVVRASLPAPGAASPIDRDEAASEARSGERGATASRPLSARPFFLGASLAGEHAFGGLSQAGFDARVGAWVVPRVGITLRFGARASPSATAPDGTADATGLLAGAGLAIALLPRDRALTLDVPLRADVERLQLSGHAAGAARASSGSAIAAFASTGLDLGWRVAPAIAIDLEATIGAPLRPVEATDASLAFTSLSSAIVGIALGARVSP